MPRTIIVETIEGLPNGERRVVQETHEALGWSTAQGGDLIVFAPGNDPLAIYARGVWRRAYFAPETPNP